MDTNKKIKLLDFKLTKRLGASLFGLYKSRFTGNGMDFQKHKEYIYGDPIKNIDWKTAGKTDKIQIKEFEDERDIKVLFVLDNSITMDFQTNKKTKKEVLEEIFYAISLGACIEGDYISSYIYSGENSTFIDYEKGFGNIYRTIKEINKPNNSKDIKFKTKKALEYLEKRNIKNNLIFIITDDTNLNNNNSLKILSITNQIIFFNIFDYFENHLANINCCVNIGNNDNSINISLKNRLKIQKYTDLRKEKINCLNDFLIRNKILYKIFYSKQDTFKELYLFFSKQKNINI